MLTSRTNFLPKTNITGTFGGSNFTFPMFCVVKFPLNGDRNMADGRPAPPPFQSVTESCSCAVCVDSALKEE